MYVHNITQTKKVSEQHQVTIELYDPKESFN